MSSSSYYIGGEVRTRIQYCFPPIMLYMNLVTSYINFFHPILKYGPKVDLGLYF